MEITLPHNWRPRDYQIPMWRYMEHGGRRSVLLWHRRAGKDDNSLRYLASAAMEKTATYWYLLPQGPCRCAGPFGRPSTRIRANAG